MKAATNKKSPSPKSEHERQKSEFVGLASHQLRTPLTNISWYVEMLRDGDAGALNPKQRKVLTEVDAGVKCMVRLINELLDATKSSSGCITVCTPDAKALKARPAAVASRGRKHHV
jgi:signal transduction histidine kinase